LIIDIHDNKHRSGHLSSLIDVFILIVVIYVYIYVIEYDIDGKVIKFDAFRGKVVYIVNVASYW